MESHETSAAAERAARFPFCRNLWSKKRFFASGPPRSEDELLDGSQACWCSLTHQKLGPDRAVADPDLCRAGRACFEPTLSASWRVARRPGTMGPARTNEPLQP